MSRLIVRDKPDHPDIKPNMPNVSCGVCGATVQIPAAALKVEHWDQLYGGPRGQLDATLPRGYSLAQWEHDRELEAWSQEHAKTHSQAEHDEYARKVSGRS